MIKPEEKRLHTRVKLQICTDEPVIGPGVAQLLELLQQTGSMKEACVPVVPFTPRNGMCSIWYSRFSRSITRSWFQRVARLPTVTNWAGW